MSLCAKLFVMYVTSTFILMKIKSFSCETFCTSTCSEKEANGNSELEVCICALSSQHFFQFLYHEVTRSTSTTLCTGCEFIAGLPPNIKFASTYVYTGVDRDIVRVKCLAQGHNTMFPNRTRAQTARNGKEIQKSNNRLFTQTAYNF